MLGDLFKGIFGEKVSHRQRLLMNMLSEIDIFQSLDEKQLLNLSSKFDLKSYEPEQYIIKGGEKPDFIGVLSSGDIKGYINIQGQKILLDDIKEGGMFLEMSYLNKTTTIANLYTQNGAIVWEMNYNKFDEILDEYPELKDLVKEKVESRNKQNAQALKEFLQKYKQQNPTPTTDKKTEAKKENEEEMLFKVNLGV